MVVNNENYCMYCMCRCYSQCVIKMCGYVTYLMSDCLLFQKSYLHKVFISLTICDNGFIYLQKFKKIFSHSVCRRKNIGINLEVMRIIIKNSEENFLFGCGQNLLTEMICQSCSELTVVNQLITQRLNGLLISEFFREK